MFYVGSKIDASRLIRSKDIKMGAILEYLDRYDVIHDVMKTLQHFKRVYHGILNISPKFNDSMMSQSRFLSKKIFSRN